MGKGYDGIFMYAVSQIHLYYVNQTIKKYIAHSFFHSSSNQIYSLKCVNWGWNFLLTHLNLLARVHYIQVQFLRVGNDYFLQVILQLSIGYVGRLTSSGSHACLLNHATINNNILVKRNDFYTRLSSVAKIWLTGRAREVVQ